MDSRILNATASTDFVEQRPGGKLYFEGGRTVGEREIEAHPRFLSEASAAWQRSNPSAPKNKRREVGFFATVSWSDRPGVIRFRFSGYKEGKLGERGINMGIPPVPPEGAAVIDFLTHPFGENSGVSDFDYFRLKPHVTGVVRSFGGNHWYGKVIA